MTDSAASSVAGTQLRGRVRDDPRQVYRASRHLIEVLLAQPVQRGQAAPAECTALRMALAVLQSTLAWGKLSDRTTKAQLASLAGMSPARTRRALAALEATGCVTYRHGSENLAGHLALCPASSDPAASPNFRGTPLDRIPSEGAARQLISDVLQHNFSAADLRVVLWVLGRLTTWMRADLLFPLHDLAEGAGISKGAAGRALASLDALGALQYQAGSGRGRHSAIALAGYPLPVEGLRAPDPSQAQYAEPELLPRPQKVNSKDTQRSTGDPVKGADPRGLTSQSSTEQVISPRTGGVCLDEANQLIEQFAHLCDRFGKDQDAIVLRRPNAARAALARALAERLQSGLTAEELIEALLYDYERPWPAGGAEDATRLLSHRLARLPAGLGRTYGRLLPGPTGDLVARLARTLTQTPDERQRAPGDVVTELSRLDQGGQPADRTLEQGKRPSVPT